MNNSDNIRIDGTDVREGKGNLVFNDGDEYEGEYRDDKFHGRGKYIWANGDVYDGQWVNGKRSGHGIATNVDG